MGLNTVGGSLISAYVEAPALSPPLLLFSPRVEREERYQNNEGPAASTWADAKDPPTEVGGVAGVFRTVWSEVGMRKT